VCLRIYTKRVRVLSAGISLDASWLPVLGLFQYLSKQAEGIYNHPF
jgi:hypothetical protein